LKREAHRIGAAAAAVDRTRRPRRNQLLAGGFDRFGLARGFILGLLTSGDADSRCQDNSDYAHLVLQ
jgi:hypothetical protein